MPVPRSRKVGPVAVGSATKVTVSAAAEGTSGSGSRYQRRAASTLAATGSAGRKEGVGVSVGWFGAGVGAVAAGVQEAIASAKVNTCARYLEVR